jgi:hypothetical protein
MVRLTCRRPVNIVVRWLSCSEVQMRPEAWARDWRHPLIHCRPDEQRLPEAARAFLVGFGLPSVVIFECRNSFEISFATLQKELVPYNATMRWGDFYSEALDREWSHQLVFGEEEFCNGHASFCVHDDDGTVNRLDCELEDPQCFVNSSVELFGMSLLFAQKWSVTTHSDGALASAESLEMLANGLKRYDPRAFQDDKSFWPGLLEYVIENPGSEPLYLEITSDPSRSKPRF